MNKRTKALSISKKTKMAVWERQGGRSIISGKPITWNECCCHYVSRARGGLGIEENIVGMTHEEHMIFDLNLPGDHLQEYLRYRNMAETHLKQAYPYWTEELCRYHKYG